MNLYAIYGSGFGLYGYLPCLLEQMGEGVVLTIEKQDFLKSRSDLVRYTDKVTWVNTRQEALALASGVVVAVPPAIQSQIIKECVKFENIQNYIIEKPLAQNPKEAAILMDILANPNHKISIGFTIADLDIFDMPMFVESNTESPGPIMLAWTFNAHHFKNEVNTWKSKHSLGGGAIRFYGIHVIALVARIGYTAVTRSSVSLKNGEPYLWEATFEGDGLKRVEILVDSNCSKQKFELTIGNKSIFSMEGPFESTKTSNPIDGRVQALKTTINRNFNNKKYICDLSAKVIKLWKDVEANLTNI